MDDLIYDTKAVYISYSRDDSFIANQLARDLELRGLTVWYDNNLLQAGTNWRDTLDRAVRNCQALILIVSPQSIQSDYVRQEVNIARQSDKRIIPLLFNRSYASELLNDFQLERFHAPSILTVADYEKVVNDITSQLRQNLKPVFDVIIERGFSASFTRSFQRLMQRPQPLQSEKIYMHYSENLSLEQLLDIENAMNEIAHYVVGDRDLPKSLLDLREDRQKIVVVDAHNHTSSTDVEIVLTAVATAILAEPEIRNFLLGYMTNVLFEVSKYMFTDRLSIGLRDSHRSIDDMDVRHPSRQVKKIGKSVEKVTQKSRFIAVAGVNLLKWGIEEQTTETTYEII